MKRYLFCILATISLHASAQTGTAYSSKQNSLYWKNRLPDKAYWQQDVQYKIDARIDEVANVIDGTEVLEYSNNSPDTLSYVYFHLYQNAFIKGSHLHALEIANKIKPRMGRYESQGLGMVIPGVRVNGKDARLELDNTILKVYLPQPLYPGSKTTFNISFKTYYDNGATRRRMKMYDAWGFKHYNGCQWYPKICVYDRKFGWDTYQHLNREFYGDFGTFDVSLDFPSNYVVEATGELQNRKEVLPDDLRAKLDIKNFARKKWDEAPSIITPYKQGERKVWKYSAANVHDFAFTADPSYRLGTTYWNGIECVAIAQEPHASGWQNGADYLAKIVKTFSEDIGMYQYPKMVAADAADGMEYPMITLDGGGDPGYRGLLVHETGHNWFYGMVGNNETYRASLDEGFTQFLTAWGLSRIDGDTLVENLPKSRYRRRFREPENVWEKRVLVAYSYDALNKEELPLSTHSDDFKSGLNHDGGYRGVYYKPASMLYNLQYALGDSLFQAALKHYFHQWRFAHPYFEDVRNSFIGFTHTDLNWFFDEWLETTKTIDYSIGSIKRIPGNDSFAIKLHRRGQMQMPIDFTVKAKDGSKHSFYIPNTWFNKNTAATALPKWYGWNKLHDEYVAHVQIPSGIRNVQIDTTGRLADVDWTNNYKTKGLPFSGKAISVKLDGGLAAPWDRRHYRLYVRPDLWWNAVDGIKAGIHFEGDYMFSLHKLDATVWFNTHVLQEYKYVVYKSEGWYERYVPLNYTFNYTTPVSKQLPKLQLQLNSRLLDGLWYHRGGFNWLYNSNLAEIYFQTMWRAVDYDKDYLIYPAEWSSTRGRPNASINLAWTHKYNYLRGNGRYTLSGRAPFLAGNSATDLDYAYGQLEAVNYHRLGKLEVRTRLFGRYGTGSNIPYESALFLAGANPEGLMENKYTRSVGFIPDDWRAITATDMNHFQQGGGLNLRGYAGYFIADNRNGQVLIGYKGRSGASANIEVDIDEYIRLRPKHIRNWLRADVYLFADAGAIELSQANIAEYWNTQPTTMWSNIRMDAGLGLAFTIKQWGVFEKAHPLILRFDMPLLLSRPPYAQPDYAGFRWVVGVNRSF